MQKKECVAMLLAGGQGSRLGILTKKIAKPAVPFGGKYRIIDFTLSNCANSGIDTVGVLTQYRPMTLNSYIGIGSSWDLDRKNGGVSVLPPYVQQDGGEWYKGTANAIYQNLGFIDKYNPDYVLVLSGDHIYKMDYGRMLDYHKQKGAAATIAVIEVPWEETHRFGIMNTDRDHYITEFQEKPKHAQNNLASMGVYVFDWDKLRTYLEADEADPNSNNDFGKNIIPTMLGKGEKLYAYPFRGYWKDVGTIDSLWEANMDLLENRPDLELNDATWKIYAMNQSLPPQYIGTEAKIIRSSINEGCQVFGEVDHSVLFVGTYIGRRARVVDSIIMPGARIEENAVVEKAIIGENTVVQAGAHVGCTNGEGWMMVDRNTSGITVVEGNIVVPRNLRLAKGAIVSVTDWQEFPEERIS